MIRELTISLSILTLSACGGGPNVYRQPKVSVSDLAFLEAPSSDIEISMIDDKFNGADGAISMRLNPKVYIEPGRHRIEIHLLATNGYYQLHCDFRAGTHYIVDRVRKDFETKYDRHGVLRHWQKWKAFIIDAENQQITCFK